MIISIKPKRIYKFPTKKELKEMTADELYSIARNRDGIKEVMINFLELNLVKKHSLPNIEMSNRLRLTLKRAGVESLDELTFFRKKEVQRFDGLGPKMFNELIAIMKDFELELRK
jgi:DNA-directed RNA polymerase alpha subunit